MVFSLRRLFVVTLLLALFATACSSSEGETPAAVATDGTESTDDGTGSTDGGTGSTDGTGAETDGDAGSDPAATSIPVPDDDPAADDAIAGLDSTTPEEPTADPATTAQEFLRNRFNIDPTPEWTDCIVNESTSDDVLDNTLRLPSVGLGEVDDTQLRTLALAINGCVDATALGDWATAAIGPQGEVAQTAPACFAESFSAEDNGDLTFYTFSSLTFQFRLDPDGTDGLVDALTECSPITALVEFFASQAEQANSFAVVVDRDCLAEALSPTEVSREFWTVFVDGGLPPVSQIDPFTAECSEEPEPAPGSDLPDVLPADFVPWSGTGALAAVAPSARANAYSSPPPITISEDASYEAVLSTGGGEVRIRLFNDTAPITVNNFVNLARDGYYDSTIFHRVLADFMAQGGDPTGTGTGGPGYQFEDEVDGGPALDRKGLLAMANAGPGTNGSQFFITFVPTEWLTGNHTVFGEVIEGIEIIDAIELRDPGAPSGPGQVIESIVIIES